MKKTLSLRLPAAAAVLLLAVGCARPHDYGKYLENMPRSVLVLPAVNESSDVTATDSYMHTCVVPLAHQGYYVFPPALVDKLMKAQGVTTANEMHEVSAKKLHEVFGCDAVLYVRIKDWETKYLAIASQTVVTLEYRLVHAASGQALWNGSARAVDSSGGSGSLIADAVGAAVHKALAETVDNRPALAAQANGMICADQRSGLLLGPLHPNYAQERERRLADQKQLEEMNAKDRG